LIIAVAVLAGAFRIAFGIARPEVEALRFVRATPHATLADHRTDPAIYSGTISGPDDRHDAGGNRAAATWWWVIERVSKDNSKTVCFEHQIDRMRFFDGHGQPSVRTPDDSAPLAMFDDKKQISLHGRDRSGEDWDDPLQIDLAEQPPYWPSEWPPEVAARCYDKKRSFVARSIPEGARVDVLACHVGDELTACPSKIAAVISLGDIDAYASRRAFHASSAFIVASVLALLLLFMLTYLAHHFRVRTIGVVVPKGPR
jgi:hypothetical protein